jgi:hypothetical protein
MTQRYPKDSMPLQDFYCPHCDGYYRAAEKARMGICAGCETELQNREMGEDDE